MLIVVGAAVLWHNSHKPQRERDARNSTFVSVVDDLLPTQTLARGQQLCEILAIEGNEEADAIAAAQRFGIDEPQPHIQIGRAQATLIVNRAVTYLCSENKGKLAAGFMIPSNP